MPVIGELFDEAVRHHQCGRLAQAETLYRQILQADPRHADAWHLLGVVAEQVGQYDLAAQCSGQALRVKPDYAEAYSNLGNVLWNQGKLDLAEASYRRALRLKPGYADAYSNLSNVLWSRGKLEEAEACCREALHLKPDFADAHHNLGNVLANQGKLEDAEASYREALRLKPTFAEAHNNLGNVLFEQGKLEEAGVNYRQALRLKPGYAEAHYNSGVYCLLHGDFAQGWAEYEWRGLTKENLPNALPPPSWDGTPLNGKTILLQAEQGFGDTFQFIRYARLVKAKGGHVVLQCQPDLAGILAGCLGIDQVVAGGTPLPSFHVRAPLLSLPMLCGTTLATIPAEVPYLAADPARVAHWRRQLDAVSGFKVGICWQGRPSHRNDRRRSVPLTQFAPLAGVPEVRLVCLQRGPGQEQWERLGGQWSVVELPGRAEEPSEAWMETAALVCALDLVITVDTAVAHLAGALAVPVWVALPFSPDWRWLLQRADSPWYPTMRLFRQNAPGDWYDVFRRIAEEVRKIVPKALG